MENQAIRSLRPVHPADLPADSSRLLVESLSSIALVMLDTSGIIVSWNPGAEHLFGYSADEIIGQPVATLYLPREIDSCTPKRDLQKALHQGACVYEGWRLRKDRSRFWSQVTLKALYDLAIHVGYSLLSNVVSERPRSGDPSQSAEGNCEKLLSLDGQPSISVVIGDWSGRSTRLDRFELLGESFQDYAIFLMDDSGSILTWSTGAERLTGYGAHEALRQHYSFYFPSVDRAEKKPDE